MSRAFRNITELLRLQIYIKLTRSNDGDGRKHPLKYLCLKCRIWWEINKTNFLFGVYCSVSVLLIYILHHSCFSLFSCDPDGPISVCTHKSYLKHSRKWLFDFMLIDHFSFLYFLLLFGAVSGNHYNRNHFVHDFKSLFAQTD